MMKRLSYYLCSCCCLIGIFSASLVYADAVEESSETTFSPSFCSKDILMTFFPQPIVKRVLVKHKISDDQAEAIAKELSKKNQELVRLVEEKASKMDPNPFKDLTNRDQAIKVFKDTLYEVFASTLNKYGITDEDQIHTFLNDMQAAKGQLFIECMRTKDKNKEPSKL